MQRFLIRRVLLVFPTMIIVSMMVFALVRLTPGDIITLLLEGLGQFSEGEDAQAMKAKLGLDKPVHIQYVVWWGKMLQGNFGQSVWTGRYATEEIIYRLPTTLELGILAIVFSTFLGVFLGVISALKQDSILDYAMRSFAIAMLSIPGFWIATMIIVIPSVLWRFTFPLEYKTIFEDPWAHIQLMGTPALLLGIERSAGIMRLTRAMMLEVLRQDYIRTARAKGLAEQMVVVRHALKNALIPVVTVIGLGIPFLLGGSVIMEQIFGLPGVGRMMIEVVRSKDFPILQSINLLFAAIIITTNLMVDAVYGLLDPRIRYA